MARFAVNVDVRASYSLGAPAAPASVDVADAETATAALAALIVTAKADAAAAAASLAVLQADGASPTEAHVDAADVLVLAAKASADALTTTPISAQLTAATLPATADVVVDVNLSNVTTKNQMKQALDAAYQQFLNAGVLAD